MNISAAFVAYPQAAKLMQLGERALHHSAVHAQAAAVIGVAPHQYQPVGTLHLSSDGWNSLYEGQPLRNIVDLRSGQAQRQGQTLGIDQQRMLAAGFASIGGVGASAFPSQHRPQQGTVSDRPRPIERPSFLPLGQQRLLDPLPGAGPGPVLQSTPTGYAQATAPLLWQQLPGNAALEHEDNSRQGSTVVKGLTAGIAKPRGLGEGSKGSISCHSSSESHVFAMYSLPLFLRSLHALASDIHFARGS